MIGTYSAVSESYPDLLLCYLLNLKASLESQRVHLNVLTAPKLLENALTDAYTTNRAR